jgi:hypothetical protein
MGINTILISEMDGILIISYIGFYTIFHGVTKRR